MSKAKKQRVPFRLIGGSRQMLIAKGEDLRVIADMDVAHWAMIGTQTDSLVCNKDFLTAMDTDNNNRIRCDEVKAALKWIFARQKDLTGFERKSDSIRLADLNLETAEGKTMHDAIKVALANLGCPDAPEISFTQVSDHEKIVSAALQNGDGVIPPDPVEKDDPLAADCIRNIMKLTGSKKDLSGVDGIDKELLDNFEKLAAGYLTWIAKYDAAPEKMLPYGEKTGALFTAMSAIVEKTDLFFRSAATLRFGNVSRGASDTLAYDPLAPETVSTFLEKSPIANPAETAELERGSDTLNPLWRDKVNAFFDALGAAEGKAVTKLDVDSWNALKAKLAPYGAWSAEKNTGIFDKFDRSVLRSYAEKNVYATVRKLIENDVAVSADLANCKEVRKLIVFQKYMLDFLNNFVCLHNLFDPALPSMIQVGKLVMDGRMFTLCTLVPNIAEHKKIVMESDICVMYVDVTRGAGAEAKAMKLAVAVTSGHVRNIFIGKSGVFFSEDGAVWDAKIFDFVKQPVSIAEAIKEPFYKFSEFLQRQADKLFATRSKAYETNVANSIQATATPGKPAPAPVPIVPGAPGAPGMSGPMMLMSGGIGIAAIGSAFAFMAKSLQGISFTTVLSVLLGIMLIFGGPIILISLIKLFNRNLSRFFEANGNAINMKMRLSLKMGRFFTFVPKVPFSMMVMPEYFCNTFAEKQRGMNFWLKLTIWLLVLLLLTGGIIYWKFPGLVDKVFGDEEEPVCAEKVVCKEEKAEKKPAACAEKTDAKPAVKPAEKTAVKPAAKAPAPVSAPAPEKKPSSAPQK